MQSLLELVLWFLLIHFCNTKDISKLECSGTTRVLKVGKLTMLNL